MSKSQKSRQNLCGNCKHFVAGGLCELVKGQIKAKDTCDLHEYGQPQTIDTEVDPTHNKLKVNYKPGFMVETTTGDIAHKVFQNNLFSWRDALTILFFGMRHQRKRTKRIKQQL